MPRRRLVVTLAILLLASASATSVAHAAQTGANTASPTATSTTASNPWPWPIICTQAAFTSYHAEELNGEVFISLDGWIRPCLGATDPGARRSFTLYNAGGATISPYVRPLLDPDTQTYTFGVKGTRSGPVTAVCVIDGVYLQTSNGVQSAVPSRRACVGIDQGRSGLVVAPIPTTDPRVLPAIPYPFPDPLDPHCGSCL
jgi:hypothetical protein